MKLIKNSIFFLLIGFVCAQERSISGATSRRNRFSAGKPQAINFNCPEDFGYYAHPTDCSQYYVCVFGGALLESCTGGLMYSTELQTCDWPRNVVCKASSGPGVSTVKITDPRTRSTDTNSIHSATESLSSSSIISRGVDNTIRNTQPLKSSGISKAIFEDPSQGRQGRFITIQEDPHQRIDNGFQAQETSSRAFNVVPSAVATPNSKLTFPPSLPGQSSVNRFPSVRSSTKSPNAENAFGDILNLNDTDYYYYYDDILYDDYYDQTAKKATTKAPVVRSSNRSRGKKGPKKSAVSSSGLGSTILNSRGRGVANSRASSSSSNLPQSSPQISSFNNPSFSSSFPNTFTASRFPTTEGEGSSSTKTLPSSSSSSNSASKSRKNKKESTRTSPSRGSSRNKPKSSPKTSAPGGKPQVVGRTPQRLVRPSKKPLPASMSSGRNVDIWKYPPRRPNPIYPQPQVDLPAAPCDRTICVLPDCYCGGKDIPGNIPPQNVPQTVLLTFDDSVNDLNKNLYIELFEKGRVNPNGCPISATFYISHEWTDYSQVQNLYSDGHEIASHSITHSFGEQFSTTKWAKEIGGQREIMSAYGGVRMEDIRGMRAPFLAVGGNNMFRMLYDLNFTYDSSMPVYENNPPSWPYTLDYKIFHDCMIPPCPKNSYPGVWQVPMVMWQDLTGGRCSMGDACTTPPDAEGVYKMLIKNFERHYTTNRSPFGLFYHAAWFTTPHHKEGFIAFLDTIAAMDDVWLVTSWQALQWVRDPTPLSTVKSFAPFQCDYPERPPRCTTPKVCNVWHKGSVRYMKTCQSCPESYPWTGSTGVPSPLNDI